MQKTMTVRFIIEKYLVWIIPRRRTIIAIEQQNILTRNDIEQRCLALAPYATIKLCQSRGINLFELAEIDDGVSLYKICAADMRNRAVIGPGNHRLKARSIDEV